MGMPQDEAYEHRIIQPGNTCGGLSAGLLKLFQNSRV